MREIGGYFELDEFYGNEYHSDAIKLNSARNALVYIMKLRKIERIFIPSFLCDSIENVLKDNNLSFSKYQINNAFEPIIDDEIDKNSFVLIVNYFGILGEKEIRRFKNEYKNIIIDNTQAFFLKEYTDIDSFNSCRKFLGVPEGSYLYTNNSNSFELSDDKVSDRFKHLLGRFEDSGSTYYKEFKESESQLAKKKLMQMSKLTQNILRAIDYQQIIHKREENFKILKENLSIFNKLNIKEIDAPFCYPLLIDNGEVIRQNLIEKKIYIPLLWPNVLNDKSCSELDKYFAKNILPLPCDQRYDENDMLYIVEEVLSCINLGN